jgi:CHAD domain-containing protein
MNYHDLHKTTVAKLREMAKAYPEVEGTSGMHKDELVNLLCDKLGIEKPHKVAVGIDKAKVKLEIRVLKKTREEALAQHDRAKLHEARKKLHKLRHTLHKATRIAG